MFFKLVLSGIVLVAIGLFLATQIITRSTERTFPPIGDFKTIKGVKFHYVDTGPVDNDKPAVVFIHGAGGNLRDQMTVYGPLLKKDARAIYIDRPGQGYSEAFDGSNNPQEQAKSIAQLLDALAIEEAVIVGHSYGGVVALAFGVLEQEKTKGLVLVAPVAYPWPGGVDWHYDVASLPFIGQLFSNLVAIPAGTLIYPGALVRLFAPNELPQDYEQTSGTRLVLRPDTFHENAKDVAQVFDHVSAFHSRYKEIKAPTYIFHGDEDAIVSAEIHSVNGLAQDIENAKLTLLKGVGHKPDYVAREQIKDAVLKILSNS